MFPISETPLNVATKMMASGGTAPTRDNSSGITFNIPVTGTDSTQHTWAYAIDGSAIYGLTAIGDGAGGIVVGGITGAVFAVQNASLGLANTNVNQPATAQLLSSEYLRVEPLSSTAGGAHFKAASDVDAQPFKLTSIFGSAAPTVTTPAIELVAAKTDGSTGITALANTEMAFKLSNNTTQLLKVMGNGQLLIGSGTTVSYPVHITSAPVGATVLGIVPTSMTSGDFVIFVSTGTVTGTVETIRTQGACSTGIAITVINTDVTNGTANAQVEVRSNGASGGDPQFLYTVSGATNWIHGIDNSDSDKWKLSAGSALGTNDVIVATTARFVGINSSSPGATMDIASSVSTSGAPKSFRVTGAAHTNLTASTEVTSMNLNFGQTKTWSTGDFATQREIVVSAPTYGFNAASTITTAITFAIDKAPSPGSNATFTSAICAQLGGNAGTYPSVTGFFYNAVQIPAHTLTMSGTTNVTSSNTAMFAIGQLTITDSSALTYDNASSLYIADAPVAAGSVTLTNKYAIFADAGLNRFDGNGTHVFELPADATDPTAGGGAAAGRIPVKIGGATKYLAYY